MEEEQLASCVSPNCETHFDRQPLTLGREGGREGGREERGRLGRREKEGGRVGEREGGREKEGEVWNV